jgi:hypothetical protein
MVMNRAFHNTKFCNYPSSPSVVICSIPLILDPYMVKLKQQNESMQKASWGSIFREYASLIITDVE